MRDAIAVCEEALARAAALDHAFITLTPERARAEAAASAARHHAGAPLGPLDGVPVAWKDLVDVAGVVTTAGSATRRDAAPAARDAAIVARLAAAGMVCIGKTNLSEFAFSGLGLNPHFGTPDNPAAPGRVPGGSSAGSAAAVAAGVVPVAIGTDTAGSIRIPAAFCGLVGFKPSVGRVSRDGVIALAPSLDSVGPLARSVVDVVAVDAALRGVAAPDAAPSAAALRLVVPAGEMVDDAEPGVRACFEAAVSRLAAAGAQIESRALAAYEETQALFDAHGSIVAAEAAREHAALIASPVAALVDPRVMTRLRGGPAILAAGYEQIMSQRARLQALLADELNGAFAVFPTVRTVAPELAPLDADPELFAQVNLRTLRSTFLGSFLDAPGVSLPVGVDDGLPVGLLVSGAPRADDAVLGAALAVEAVLGSGAR